MSTRIFVIADVHANLPALQAVLAAVARTSYDAIFHVGDAIDIGPFPAECLDLLLGTLQMQFVMGNHDAWFAHGLPEPRPASVTEEKEQHYSWTHANIPHSVKTEVARWPYLVEVELEGVAATFVHYGLTPCARDFVSIVKEPSAEDFAGLFKPQHNGLVFYGHDHIFSDVQGHARYINPGSLGCCVTPTARYTMVEFEKGKATVEHHSIEYDDTTLYRAYEQRKVPRREHFYRAFFGSRFQKP